jgi:hypothetical protein
MAQRNHKRLFVEGYLLFVQLRLISFHKINAELSNNHPDTPEIIMIVPFADSPACSSAGTRKSDKRKKKWLFIFIDQSYLKKIFVSKNDSRIVKVNGLITSGLK